MQGVWAQRQSRCSGYIGGGSSVASQGLGPVRRDWMMAPISHLISGSHRRAHTHTFTRCLKIRGASAGSPGKTNALFTNEEMKLREKRETFKLKVFEYLNQREWRRCLITQSVSRMQKYDTVKDLCKIHLGPFSTSKDFFFLIQNFMVLLNTAVLEYIHALIIRAAMSSSWQDCLYQTNKIERPLLATLGAFSFHTLHMLMRSISVSRETYVKFDQEACPPKCQKMSELLWILLDLHQTSHGRQQNGFKQNEICCANGRGEMAHHSPPQSSPLPNILFQRQVWKSYMYI